MVGEIVVGCGDEERDEHEEYKVWKKRISPSQETEERSVGVVGPQRVGGAY